MRYQSPFSTRYGSDEMRSLWSDTAKRRTWRRVWVAVAEVQAAAGLVSAEQIDDIKAHALDIDVTRAAEIEAQIGHDVVAELRTFTEQCKKGGAVLHWGLTSADVEDNADVFRQKAALTILLKGLRELLLQFAERIDETADLAVLGYTHLQPALPTTLGYRLATYAQELLLHFNSMARRHRSLKGKGIKGAVGTAASFMDLLEGSPISYETLEATVMQTLGIEPFPITSQTYPRVQDFLLLSDLAALAASLHKFAFDLRMMQSPGFKVASEPFGERQVGSSAMPFKRNPVKAENICSLARWVAAGMAVAWENSASNLLERTLDDKSNRRMLIPETFLACDHMLQSALEIMQALEVDRTSCENNLKTYGPFIAIERVLTALVRAGADRQEMHERLRQHSLAAWNAMQSGQDNPLADQISSDTTLLQYLQPARFRELLDVGSYLGVAPERSRALANQIREKLMTPANTP